MRKKIIGTTVYGILLVFLFGAAAVSVQAKFLSLARMVDFEGVVTSVAGYQMTVQAAGMAEMQVAIDPVKTLFGGAASSINDVMPGDGVTVLGTQSGEIVSAKIIKKVPGAGYGSQGPAVLITRGTIVAKGPSSLTIDTGAGIMMVQISISTRFMGAGFAALGPGGTVSVIGRDSGGTVIATTVQVFSSGNP